MTNLFQTLYNIDSHDTDDVSQEILNDAHGHLDINEILSAMIWKIFRPKPVLTPHQI